jgi:hypothetical protein
MAAPTFVAEAETAWNSNSSPRTQSVTVTAGERLVVIASSEDGSTTLATPTGGSLTYTLQQSVVVGSYCTAYVWTATASSSTTFDVSITASGGGQFGFNVLRFSGSDGFGASSKTNVASGAPSLSLTAGSANSAIVAITSDWNAGSGARTWRTINSITPSSGNGLEVSYAATGNYTTYGAYWSDAGTAGSKTVGLSAPTGQKYAIVALEVLGTAGSADATPTPAATAAVVALPAAIASASSTRAPAVTAVVVSLPAAGKSAGSTLTPAAIANPVTLPAATVSAAATVAPAATAAVVSLPLAAAGAAAIAAPQSTAVAVAHPSAAVSAGTTVTPAAIAAAVALPASTRLLGATATPSAIAATVAFPAVTVQVGGSATVTPQPIAAVASLPGLTLSASSTVTPSTLATTVSLPAATKALGVVREPATIAATVALPASARLLGAGPSPATIAVLAAVPRPVIPSQEDARGAGGYITASTPAGRITTSTPPRHTTSTPGGRL